MVLVMLDLCGKLLNIFFIKLPLKVFLEYYTGDVLNVNYSCSLLFIHPR
jgi:hypothetical protein